MKKQRIILTLSISALTSVVCAQPGNRPGGPGGPGGEHPILPIIEALDSNKDGAIDADEITNAPKSLKKLDKNHDGKLTEDEFRPKPPGGAPGGPGGPGGSPGGPGRSSNSGAGGQRGPAGPGGGPGGHHPPPSPVIVALDLNKDGVIDASEITKATESLKKLDRNHDGKLTREELHPPPPEGAGGPPR